MVVQWVGGCGDKDGALTRIPPKHVNNLAQEEDDGVEDSFICGAPSSQQEHWRLH